MVDKQNYPRSFTCSYRKLLFFLITTLIVCSVNIQMKAQVIKSKLIEFGWDYPDINQLDSNLPSMQNTPFDGICFSLQRRITEAFDTDLHNEVFFCTEKLKQLKWGKYKDNYIILHGSCRTGGSWFDDKRWEIIEKNMNGLSKSLLIGKLKGILFDPEYYYEDSLFNPWTYSKKQYPDLTFGEVQKQVVKRGTQFINALQKSASNFNFLSIWVTGLIAEDLERRIPLQDARQPLLSSFIEGILIGKKNTVKIIDGNESGYWYTKPSQFLLSTAYLKNTTLQLMQSPKAKKLVPEILTSQPVFYDGLLTTHPAYNRGVLDSAKWKWLEENTKFAIAASSSGTAWCYSQRINWWRNQNISDTLVYILSTCKRTFTPGIKIKSLLDNPFRLKSNNVNAGYGFYYANNPKTPMKTTGTAFSYEWNSKTKTLSIDFKNDIPQKASVFVDNTLTTSLTPKTKLITIKNIKKGRVSILAEYKNNIEACGLSVY